MISSKHPDEEATHVVEIEHAVGVGVAGCPEYGLAYFQTGFQIKAEEFVLLRKANENLAICCPLCGFADEGL